MKAAWAESIEPQALVPHGASILALAGTLMGYIPVVIAIIPALYYLLLIYESVTVQGWLAHRRALKAAIKLAKLKAQVIVVSARIDAAADVKAAKVTAAAAVDNAAIGAEKLLAKTAAGVTDAASKP